MPRDRLRDLTQDVFLVGLPQAAQVLRVAACVRNDLVAAPADGVGDLRRVLVDQAVRAVPGGELELVQQVEQAPDADPIAVVAPGIIAVRLRLAGLRRVVAEARAEGEPLDVGGDGEREPPALGPCVVAPRRQGRIVIAVVLRQQRLQILISSAYSPPAWRSTAKTMPRSSTNTSLICAVGRCDPSGFGGTKYAISRGW